MKLCLAVMAQIARIDVVSVHLVLRIWLALIL